MPETTPHGWPYAVGSDPVVDWPNTSADLATKLEGARSTAFASFVSGQGLNAIDVQQGIAIGDIALIYIAARIGGGWPSSNATGNIADVNAIKISAAWLPAQDRVPVVGVTPGFTTASVIVKETRELRVYAISAPNTDPASDTAIYFTATYQLAAPIGT